MTYKNDFNNWLYLLNNETAKKISVLNYSHNVWVGITGDETKFTMFAIDRTIRKGPLYQNDAFISICRTDLSEALEEIYRYVVKRDWYIYNGLFYILEKK